MIANSTLNYPEKTESRYHKNPKWHNHQRDIVYIKNRINSIKSLGIRITDSVSAQGDNKTDSLRVSHHKLVEYLKTHWLIKQCSDKLYFGYRQLRDFFRDSDVDTYLKLSGKMKTMIMQRSHLQQCMQEGIIETDQSFIKYANGMNEQHCDYLIQEWERLFPTLKNAPQSTTVSKALNMSTPYPSQQAVSVDTAEWREKIESQQTLQTKASVLALFEEQMKWIVSASRSQSDSIKQAVGYFAEQEKRLKHDIQTQAPFIKRLFTKAGPFIITLFALGIDFLGFALYELWSKALFGRYDRMKLIAPLGVSLWTMYDNIFTFIGYLMLPLCYNQAWLSSSKEGFRSPNTISRTTVLYSVAVVSGTTTVLWLFFGNLMGFLYLSTCLFSSMAMHRSEFNSLWPNWKRRLRYFISKNGSFKCSNLILTTEKVLVGILWLISGIMTASGINQFSIPIFMACSILHIVPTMIQTLVEEVFFRSPLAHMHKKMFLHPDVLMKCKLFKDLPTVADWLASFVNIMIKLIAIIALGMGFSLGHMNAYGPNHPLGYYWPLQYMSSAITYGIITVMSGGIEAAWLAHFINNYPINVLIVGYGPLSSDFDMRQRIVALVNRCVPYTILSIASKANIHRRVKNLVMTLAIKVPCKLGFNIALLAIYNWVRPVTAKRFQTSECCGNESQHQPLESISITSNLLEGRCFMWDQARLATRRLGWFSRQVKPIIPEKSAFYDRGNIEFANSSI